MSSLAPAHEYFEDKRQAALTSLALAEPQFDQARRSAIAYFDTEYGGRTSGSSTVKDKIAEAFLQGRNRKPFLREDGTHLSFIVHPEAPYVGNLKAEMEKHHIFLKFWLRQRSALHIDSGDTNSAVELAMSHWRNQYREALNSTCDLSKNFITFAGSSSPDISQFFTYNKERQINTIPAEGIIDYSQLDKLFDFTQGIHPSDECEVSGSYAGLCVPGLANFFIGMWQLGLYYRPQADESEPDSFREHVQELNDMIVQISLAQQIRCKLGVVFDSLGVQTVAAQHVLLKHLFDKGTTQAFPRCSEMNRDLESFADIKTVLDLNRI